MLIAGSETEDIGLGTAQFAFRDRTAEDSVATVTPRANYAPGADPWPGRHLKVDMR